MIYRKYQIIFLSLTILFFVHFVDAQDQIKFNDGKSADVEESALNKSGSKDCIHISSHKFNAALSGFGKAIKPFADADVRRILKLNKAIGKSLKLINTSYVLNQNNHVFYLAGYDSISTTGLEKCTSDFPCTVECDAILIKMSTHSNSINVLIIKSIKIISGISF